MAVIWLFLNFHSWLSWRSSCCSILSFEKEFLLHFSSDSLMHTFIRCFWIDFSFNLLLIVLESTKYIIWFVDYFIWFFLIILDWCFRRRIPPRSVNSLNPCLCLDNSRQIYASFVLIEISISFNLLVVLHLTGRRRWKVHLLLLLLISDKIS